MGSNFHNWLRVQNSWSESSHVMIGNFSYRKSFNYSKFDGLSDKIT